MNKYYLSEQAVQDIINIGVYSEKKWNKNKRNEYVKLLYDTFKTLAENPNMGKQCDEIGVGFRKFPVGSHIIYYQIVNGEPIKIIEVQRILHKREDAVMDFE